jgi:hypothetical protein
MSAREFMTALVLGVAGAAAFTGTVWLILDAYTRIAYAALGIPYPG